MKSTTLFSLLGLSFVLCPAVAVEAQEWGTLKGRFVYEGTPEAPAPINITKDAAYCGEHNIVDQSVLVAEDGSLKNVIVFIRTGRNEELDVHPDYASQLSDQVVLDNHFCEFDSHVTLVQAGQPFVIKNSDQVGHNTNASLQANGNFNVIIAAGESQEMSFGKQERLPLPVACNIHPWMKGYLLVLDHPYMAKSGEDGSFEIANIPAGEHEFQFWHESPGYLKDCEYEGGSLDRRGRTDIEIGAGETVDLGEIKVPASLFN